MADTSIEWTERVLNATTGCDRVSPGCDHCYALRMAGRLKAMGQAKYQQDGNPRTSGPGFDLTLHPDVVDVPRRWKTGRRIFVNSMSDLFHARVPLDFQQRLFTMMAETPQHTYQILTKRSLQLVRRYGRLEWPANVWMGVSVESAAHRYRIDHLRQVPARVRFVSAEPLLGSLLPLDLTGIHWVITGGESGPGARAVDPAWVREIRDQCLLNECAFFHKQWGGTHPKQNGRHLDGRTWDQYPGKALPAAQL
ncbi:phage Gp37/Gp68 family protein [Kineosporia rhizophila]|uniref:DUF5131 family protein n=1 Tax=Kineosporia rhizophila TaxID=84633 RepID=UPI000A9DD9EE|nr:phage Gp37/Gp68 family protein [Kineosporia rhizophila]